MSAALLLTAVLAAGCGEEGPGLPALPTALPSVTLPTALPTALPTVDVPTLPPVTVPTSLPTLPPGPTDEPAPPEPTAEPAPPEPTAEPAPPEPTAEPAPPETTAEPAPVETETTAPPVAAPEAEAADDGVPWWVWLLGALLLAATVALLVLWNRRRAARAAWDAQLTAAADEARWVEGSLVPDVLRAGTAMEASAVWTAARPRVLALDEELFTLAANAPDEERAAYATLLQERLRALSAAVDADASAGADVDADRLRAGRGTIDRARADLVAALDSPVRPGRAT